MQLICNKYHDARICIGIQVQHILHIYAPPTLLMWLLMPPRIRRAPDQAELAASDPPLRLPVWQPTSGTLVPYDIIV
jgi:hypothetical protein